MKSPIKELEEKARAAKVSQKEGEQLSMGEQLAWYVCDGGGTVKVQ